jgi:phospholipase/lecithinase/hemolysin
MAHLDVHAKATLPSNAPVVRAMRERTCTAPNAVARTTFGFGRILAASFTALLAASCGVSDDEAENESRGIAEMSSAIASASGDPLTTQVLDDLGRPGKSGNRIRHVLVFGDSLSDVGTYGVGVVAAAGGGKFTTNPGPIWSEMVGALLGSPVTPFRQGLAGSSEVLGGTGFAMGGARVAQQPGIGCDPDPTTGSCKTWMTIPVAQQIGDYLGANSDRFDPDQLVFLLAGANDILYQLGVFQANVQAGEPVDPAQAAALGAVQEAASDLVTQVQRIKTKGGSRVVVLNVPDLSDTPFGNAADTAPVRPLVAAMVQYFNQTLAAGLQGTGATLLDLAAREKDVVSNPKKYHVKDTTTPACDAEKIAELTGGLVTDGISLFCSSQTLVKADAPLKHLFADSLHPSTVGHAVVASFVLVELWQRGLLR